MRRNFLRGCAGVSDLRERKATPSGVFDSLQKRAVRGLGCPQQAIGISVKDIANHCLPTLPRNGDNAGYTEKKLSRKHRGNQGKSTNLGDIH